MHTRTSAGNVFDVIDAFGGFEQRVDHDRLAHMVFRFQLCEQLIEIVYIPRPFNLRQHDDIELLAHRCHDLHDIVENPGAVQRVDACPKPGAAESIAARDLHED